MELPILVQNDKHNYSHERCGEGLFEFVPDEEEDTGADYGYYEFACPTVGLKAELLEEPAAEEAANDSEEEIYEAAFALTVGELCCNESCKDSGYYSDDHILLMVIGYGL